MIVLKVSFGVFSGSYSSHGPLAMKAQTRLNIHNLFPQTSAGRHFPRQYVEEIGTSQPIALLHMVELSYSHFLQSRAVKLHRIEQIHFAMPLAFHGWICRGFVDRS